MAPRCSQRLSRRPPDAFSDSREAPGKHQKLPKRPRKIPKTPPMAPQRHPNSPRPVSRKLLTDGPGMAV
eukprot:5674040-Pyramimonas_sp.AAC.1